MVNGTVMTLFTLLIALSLFILLLLYKHRGIPGKIISLIGQNTLGICFLQYYHSRYDKALFFNSLPPDFFRKQVIQLAS
jgi:hypothetical protein